MRGGPVRALGAAGLAALLVGAAVVAQLIGPAVRGTPTAAPVPAEPGIGACVATDSFLTHLATQLPSATYGPCAQPHVGEVVGLADVADQFPTMIMDQLSVPDPRGCASAAVTWLGLGAVAEAVRPWVLRDIAPVEVVGPDLRQRAAGQSWVGCVSYSPAGPLTAALPQLFAAGALPASFGTCLSDLGGSCGAGHTDEVFADIDLTYALPAAAGLTATCTRLIGALTRMPDVTADGRLQVRMTVVHYDQAGSPHPGYPTAADQPGSATCGLHLSGPGRLTATLLGLGTRPLPLTT